MSRQEMRAYGKQEFGQFPLITMEPLPERLTDYYKVSYSCSLLSPYQRGSLTTKRSVTPDHYGPPPREAH